MTMTFKQKYVKSFDGTRIGYQVAGRGKTPFVLCNGLGGSMIAWSPLYEYFAPHFKFITWDYRGLFTSDIPKNMATLAIPYHVKDVEAILKKEKVNAAVVGGWSMGVQVALEFYRQRPGFFRGIFLINGTCGYPLETAFNSPLTRYVVPTLNNIIKRVMPRVQPRLAPVAKLVISSEEFIKIIVGLGMIHKDFDASILRSIANDIVETNLAVYHEILDHLCVHNACDVLPMIKVPTLVMAGTRDIMTPHHAAEKMAARIPGAELFIMNGASHYSLLEFPDMINKRLEQFINEHSMLTEKPARKKRKGK